MKHFIKILIILEFMSISTGMAQCRYNNTAFQEGEKLSFTGYYHLGMIWIAAGRVDMYVNKGNYKGKSVYKINSYGSSAKSFEWFFKLRDTLSCYMDINTLKPYFYDKITHEKNYHSRRTYHYDYANKKIYSSKKKRGKTTLDTIGFSGCFSDMVSVAYHSRNIDFEKYGQGAKIPITLIVSGKIHNVFIRFLGSDVVKTRHRKSYECYKISPMLPEGSMFKGGQDMVVWLSKDANRVPIMVEAKVSVGKVKGILENYDGLRSESNSIFGAKKGTFEKSKKK